MNIAADLGDNKANLFRKFWYEILIQRLLIWRKLKR